MANYRVVTLPFFCIFSPIDSLHDQKVFRMGDRVTRLNTIDLEEGIQPITNESNDIGSILLCM